MTEIRAGYGFRRSSELASSSSTIQGLVAAFSGFAQIRAATQRKRCKNYPLFPVDFRGS